MHNLFDGKIEIRDYSEMKELNFQLRKIGININQIAKRINETNSIYREDIRDVQNKQEEIWQLLKSLLSRLKKLELVLLRQLNIAVNICQKSNFSASSSSPYASMLSSSSLINLIFDCIFWQCLIGGAI